MKTFLTLLVSFLLTAATFAADRRPIVTVNGNRNYVIVIDGKRYFDDNDGNFNIRNLRNGFHTIKVYDMRKGWFRRNARLISSNHFRLRDNDLYINIDRFGDVRIHESRYGNNRRYGKNGRDRNWNERDKNWDDRNKDWNDHNGDKDDRDYDR